MPVTHLKGPPKITHFKKKREKRRSFETGFGSYFSMFFYVSNARKRHVLIGIFFKGAKHLRLRLRLRLEGPASRWLGSHRFVRWTFGDFSKSHQRKNGKRKFMFDAFILSNLINWQQRLIKLLLYFNSICFYEDAFYQSMFLPWLKCRNIHQPPPKKKKKTL